MPESMRAIGAVDRRQRGAFEQEPDRGEDDRDRVDPDHHARFIHLVGLINLEGTEGRKSNILKLRTIYTMKMRKRSECFGTMEKSPESKQFKLK